MSQSHTNVFQFVCLLLKRLHSAVTGSLTMTDFCQISEARQLTYTRQTHRQSPLHPSIKFFSPYCIELINEIAHMAVTWGKKPLARHTYVCECRVDLFFPLGDIIHCMFLLKHTSDKT